MEMFVLFHVYVCYNIVKIGSSLIWFGLLVSYFNLMYYKLFQLVTLLSPTHFKLTHSARVLLILLNNERPYSYGIIIDLLI